MLKVFFFSNPSAKRRVRQLSRELQLVLPSVIRYCKELLTEEIIQKEEITGISLYSANRVSSSYSIEKKCFNLKTLIQSGLIDYLRREHANPVVILFGSFAKGEDIEVSDIDLYIETPKKHTFNLHSFEEILKKKIQVFNYKSINDVKNSHLANNIINGIILNNYLEVFK